MSARRVMGASCIGIALALACGALAPASARAENLLTLGGGPFIPDGGKTEQGIGLALAIPTQSWISIQMRADASRAYGHGYGTITFGPQIGTTRGKLRPYFNAGAGFVVGEVDFSGLAISWGAGASCDLVGDWGVFADAHSLSASNFEYDAHFKQFRAGVSLRSGQRTK